ncbi:MAG: hypothetical protein WAU78_14345 [Roseiarcus sp.]
MSPMATTLLRVTEELRKVSGRLEKVDVAVGRLVFEAASPTSAHFRDLQDIDRANQEVAGIAEFLEKLARAVPPEWLADPKGASSSVDLHELASNLAQIEAKEADSHAADGHDCELFE